MPDFLKHKAHQMPKPVVVNSTQPLLARQTSVGLLNLRGNPDDTAWVAAVEEAMGMRLALAVCSTLEQGGMRNLWAGPDEFWVLTPQGQETALAERLRSTLAGQHHAVTDVSSGFFLVDLLGAQARGVLAQGCPMDLHPRAFPAGRAVGTHFFKVGLTLWASGESDGFQMLVRRSFIDHFWQLIDHASLEHGRAAA